MATQIETAERLYAALDADVDAFLELCADDAEIVYPADGALAYGGRWTGRDGVRRFLDAHDAEEEILEFSVDRMVVDGDDVLVRGRFRGVARATEREWSTDFVHVMTIRGARLARWQAIFDTAAALAAHAQPPSIATLRAIADAFNRHDLDAIMSHFTDDAVFESPRGSDAWGRRFEGKAEVRDGLAARFAGIPDVHYGADDHFVVGDRGASEWTLTGTTTDGERIEVRGCDLWTFRDGLVSRKDSYWKIRVAP